MGLPNLVDMFKGNSVCSFAGELTFYGVSILLDRVGVTFPALDDLLFLIAFELELLVMVLDLCFEAACFVIANFLSD